MSSLTVDQFDKYFTELQDQPPYHWQRRLADRAANGDWPGAIDLPTGTGKTACLDIAVFALACQTSLPMAERTAPRRIFFCVNRRVIVDEAYQRARRMAERIWVAERNGVGILTEVALALRTVAGSKDRPHVPPLDVLELRGGIYRDNRWARSITQPTIVCTTLDQLGSRLLFRGYGVSSSAAPIHAALIASDALILLDEAHISEPFRQTLEFVTHYVDSGKWVEQSIGVRPSIVVPMTATPNEPMRRRGVIRIEADDRDPSYRLVARLSAPKSSVLRPPVKDFVEAAVKVAVDMSADKPFAIGIIVNRVATARSIYQALRRLQADTKGRSAKRVPAGATVELVIGSMRPIDRDAQAERLRPLVGPERPRPQSKQTSFVVATQCLEVGADYDFDALITECASIDALRQRFGRLNRAGRETPVQAIILADQKSIRPDDKLDDEKPLDSIYGNALARTWNWLKQHAIEEMVDGTPVQHIDLGIDAFDTLLRAHDDHARPPQNLLAPSASLDAPVMMPAYVDLWCQTAPRPTPDPDVSLFIHGSRGGEPDVQVCWRADLVEDDRMQADKHWCDVVALLPPSSAECMRVPISRIRRWLKGDVGGADGTSDVIGEIPHDEDQRDGASVRKAVLWRGAAESELIESVRQLRPGDTVVLPADVDGSYFLGHLPELFVEEHMNGEHRHRQRAAVSDHGETAFRRAHDRAALRLHPALRDHLGSGFDELLSAIASLGEERMRHEEWQDLLSVTCETLADDNELKGVLRSLRTSRLRVEPYPDGRGVVLISRKRLDSTTDWFVPATGEGEDEMSHVERDHPVLLSDHTGHVVQAVRASLETIPLSVSHEVFRLAAELHDIGKADERFQAMLRRSNRTDAWLFAGVSSALWAKSDGVPRTRAERRQVQRRAGLPDAFRHEMLSVQLAQHGPATSEGQDGHDLLLHLIAAHHGHARPFAPVVDDDELPAVTINGIDLSHHQRVALIPPHRVDSGVAERFWRLTRRYGWWGLAYVEAVLRLADQQASADEDSGSKGVALVQEPQEIAT